MILHTIISLHLIEPQPKVQMTNNTYELDNQQMKRG